MERHLSSSAQSGVEREKVTALFVSTQSTVSNCLSGAYSYAVKNLLVLHLVSLRCLLPFDYIISSSFSPHVNAHPFHRHPHPLPLPPPIPVSVGVPVCVGQIPHDCQRLHSPGGD
jgi:hypothetical protein